MLKDQIKHHDLNVLSLVDGIYIYSRHGIYEFFIQYHWIFHPKTSKQTITHGR